MGDKAKKKENSRPLTLNLIVIFGYSFLVYVMWPDIKDQVSNMRNSRVEGYAVVITSLFAVLLLVVMLCLVDVLKRIMK